MPRKLRLEFSGACYHVLNRGNYRRNLFATDGAAESFERCLFEAVGRFGWRLHAFVIMRNHFHLALETPEPNLSAGIHAIASAIGEGLPELVADGTVGLVNESLDFLDRSGLVLGRRRAEVLLKQMSAMQWTDRHSFSALVAMIRQQA